MNTIRSMVELTKNFFGEKYYIKFWESEYARDQGISSIYDDLFFDKDYAIKTAKELFDKYHYASIEVLNQDDYIYYFRDEEEEQIEIDGHQLSIVDSEMLNKYIDCWSNQKTLPIYSDKLYCIEYERCIAVDNTSGNCYVEKFNTEKEAQDWLLGKEKEEELEMG